MSYMTRIMTLSSQKTTISEKNSFMTLFLLCSYFCAHPTTLLLKILGGRMHGPSPTSHFGGTDPPVPLGLRLCPLTLLGQITYWLYTYTVLRCVALRHIATRQIIRLHAIIAGLTSCRPIGLWPRP